MIERFASSSPYEDVIGYSRVVRAGAWFLTAGCTATVEGQLVGAGDPYAQTVAALNVGLAALTAAGCPADNVVSCRVYLTEQAHADAAGRAHLELLGEIRPALTMIVVKGFINPEMLVEIELTGYAGAEE